ncbi:MAG: hypothetical protein QM755_03045 [Luteolibacter sp.]
MTFYRIGVAETSPNRYAWASGYGPVEFMPFLDSFSEEIRESKWAFWKLNETHPGFNIDPGGREWPDLLGCGGGPPMHFFSERMLRDLQEEGIPFFRCTELPMGRNSSKRLQQIPPPNYFVLEAEPSMTIRSVPVPIEPQVAARNETPPRWLLPYRTFGDIGTWNGTDLFSPSHGKSLVSLFCTERVRELAGRRGWINVAFRAIELE